MSADPRWVAWLPDRPRDALIAAEVTALDGADRGWLAVWAGTGRPHAAARRIDPAAVDATGPPAAVSLVWPERRAWPLFDDPAVVHAVRAASTVPHLRASSTFTADATHFAGSLLATSVPLAARWPAWWTVDPFARLGLRHCLIVGPGVVAGRPAALGPGTQRRSGSPWPASW